MRFCSFAMHKHFVSGLTLLVISSFSQPAITSADPASLPYRFLLVIDDQWQDPASYLVRENNEFQVIVTLLKNWGLPFDILRLDQERFDYYHLLDRENRPRYGTVIWATGISDADSIDLRILPSLVQEYGVNLVALGSSAAIAEIEDLCGVQYVSDYRLGDGLDLGGEHFITRELGGRVDEFNEQIDYYAPGSKVMIREAEVIAKRGHLPFLTVREIEGGGHVVWMGVHHQSVQIKNQLLRDLFKRSLVWANGYALYSEYQKSLLLFMDDFGTSDRTYLPYWHYRTLDEQDIRNGIIEPLKRHNAVLNLNVLSGYVDRKTQRIVSPWKQQVVDELDGQTFHDYVSAKQGIDAGLREGVFEIQCHGYTHMLPDLESPPGPFWSAEMDGAGTLGFDYEFGDPMRNREIPAITQKFLLARGLQYIREDFDVTPLFVINGGSAWSRSYPNHSARIAAEMGFGLSHFNSPGYLGRDLVIPTMEPVVLRDSWQYDIDLTGDDIPWTIDAPFFLIFHDRDVSIDGNALERLLKNLGKGVRYVSANEYCGYLHARVKEVDPALSLEISYDDHYCRYFRDHRSSWILHLSDGMRERLTGGMPEKRIVTIPAGSDRYVFRIDKP